MRFARLGVMLAAFAAALLVAPSSAEWAITPTDKPVAVEVLGNSPDRITLYFSIKDYQLHSVPINGEKYATVTVPGEPVLLEAGAPSLPRVCRSVIVPDDAEMAVSVLFSDYREIPVKVAPSKGNLPRTIDPATVPYTFGEAYQADAFFPGELVQLRPPHILRDYRGVTVEVYPFQYNPATQTLRVYSELVVQLTRVGPGQVNVLTRSRDRALSRAFHNIYTHHFLNYDPGRYDPLNEEGELLIICHDPWVTNVEPLADHKNAIGIDTTIVPVSMIGNNATAIKNYIQSVYDSSDLAFVLLVGDAAQVATPSASGGASDPTYSKLAGSDDYPDIIVGRFSAETAAQVDTQVLRTIEYEQLPATAQAWFKRGTGIGSEFGTGDDGEYDWEHIQNIRAQLLAYGYTLIDELYGTSPVGPDDVAAALNDGRGIINYCGHGSTTSWGTTGFSNGDINELVNDNMLPFIFSVACVNGEFDGYTCFGEAWLRATHNGEPTGAIGAYMSSINQSWSPPMEAQDEFNNLIVNEAYWSYGAYCYAGSCSMMDAYGADGVEMFNTWHIFGDPSVRIFGEATPPHGLRVSPSSGLVSEGPTGGPFTPASITYTLTNANESGTIEYEVTKSAPWLTLTNASGTLAAGETADVTVSINAYASSLGNGEYSDDVAFVNLTDHDGDTTRHVTLTVGVPTLQYEWNMDTDPGWDTEGLWAWGQPTGGGGDHGYPDPTGGHTGPYVYGYNLNGDYENNLPERHLTSGPIDCSDLTEVSVKFWRYLGVEQPWYDHAYFRVSTDGVTWQTLWENGTEIADSSWQLMEFDLSTIADHAATLYLRWTMGPTDYSWQYCGWNIDDVQIWGLAPSEPPALTGDLNCDGQVNAFDIDPFILALTDPDTYAATYPGCNILNGDFNEDGVVNAFDIDPFIDALTGG